MTHSELLTKVMERIDEVGINESVSLNFPIAPFIVESANQLMMSLPIDSLSNFVDFSSSEHTVIGNGCGVVALPEGFLKLYEFKMDGWLIAVNRSEPLSRNLLYRQQYNSTRATPSSPIVAISGDKLFYYGATTQSQALSDSIESALALCAITDSSEIDDIYGDIVSWLCASKVLQVMNEQAAASLALAQYNQLLPIFGR